MIKNQAPLFDDLLNRIDPHVVGDETIGRILQDDHIALFAGWLKAKTKFDTDLKGDISTFQANPQIPIPFLTGTYKGDLDQKFKYDGPFVGTNLSMPIQIGFLEVCPSINRIFFHGTAL